MILPIVAFGSFILRQKCKYISSSYPNIQRVISNMFETMYAASGVGLAAPQVNKSIRIFIIDTTPFAQDEDLELVPVKQVFINPRIIKEEGQKWLFNEGCLSIPEIREDIYRRPNIEIEFFDEEFKLRNKKFDGITARIIQHEYDHLNGVLFIDKISPLRKQLIKGKLTDITKGNIRVDYKIKFSKK